MRTLTVQLACIVLLACLHAPAYAQGVGPQLSAETTASDASRPLGAPAPESRSIGSDRPASSLGIGRTVGAIGVVAGLALAGWVVVRCLARAQGGLAATLGPGGRAPSGVLEVLGRYPVGRAQTLVLLRVDRRVLLLSQTALGRLGTGSTFATLCEVTDPEDVASILVKARDDDSRAASDRFSNLLSRYDREHDPFAEQSADIPIVDLTKRQRRPASIVESFKSRWDASRNGGAA